MSVAMMAITSSLRSIKVKRLAVIAFTLSTLSFKCLQRPTMKKRILSNENQRPNPLPLQPLTNAANEMHRMEDKFPVTEMIEKAGVPFDEKDFEDLPSQSSIEQLYGRGPYIHGLEMCEDFRKKNSGKEVMLATGGLFNTGTSFLRRLLSKNCQIGDVREDIWWKHSPAQWTHKSEFSAHRPNQQTKFGVQPYKHTEYIVEDGKGHIRYEPFYRNILPIISMKDPFYWFSSMCRNRYSAKWGTSENFCPNLVPSVNTPDENLSPEVDVYPGTPRTYGHPDIESFHMKYDSLVHYWNQFYKGYLNAPFPRLILRYEDVLFHTEEVVSQVCECAGGTMNTEFEYVYSPRTTKKHGFLEAVIKYGRSDTRLEGLTGADIEFARKSLDLELMEKFRYHVP
mmetsp:Transcript_4543/g.5795  ORF Transcript_4543/g.5795 Transcript_4543/m.5795 type:complete len:396 (+) Transcript_4543:38-1225(+)